VTYVLLCLLNRYVKSLSACWTGDVMGRRAVLDIVLEIKVPVSNKIKLGIQPLASHSTD
jgi:hypothetical protein